MKRRRRGGDRRGVPQGRTRESPRPPPTPPGCGLATRGGERPLIRLLPSTWEVQSEGERSCDGVKTTLIPGGVRPPPSSRICPFLGTPGQRSWLASLFGLLTSQNVFEAKVRGVFQGTRDSGGGEGRGGGETLQDEGAAEEKGQLLLLSYGNGNEVGHGPGDNGGTEAGPASPCKLLPVREPFSPGFYWLTGHLQDDYKEAPAIKAACRCLPAAAPPFPG